MGLRAARGLGKVSQAGMQLSVDELLGLGSPFGQDHISGGGFDLLMGEDVGRAL